jgi:hypothetical protein
VRDRDSFELESWIRLSLHNQWEDRFPTCKTEHRMVSCLGVAHEPSGIGSRKKSLESGE